MHTIGYFYKIANSTNDFKKLINEAYDSIMSDPNIDYCNIGPIKEIYENSLLEETDAMNVIDEKTKNYDTSYSYYIPFLRKRSALLKSLESRLEKEESKLADYTKKSSIKNRKSESVTCTYCKSKLTISFLSANLCPVCQTSLLSKTTLDTISRYKKNISDLNRQIQQEKTRLKKEKVKTKKSDGVKNYILAIHYDYHS